MDMSDKLNFSQIQDFQLNLADKALKESQTEIDALRAENERLRVAQMTWTDNHWHTTAFCDHVCDACPTCTKN